MVLISGVTLFSNLLGLFRDAAYANTWGVQDIAFAGFLMAFTVPNLFRGLFGEGAFSAAFIPVLSRRLHHSGKAEAWKTACTAVTVMAAVLSAIVLLLIPLCLLLRPLADHFHKPVWEQALLFLPAMLPYAVLVCVTAAFTGILNTFNHFGLPSLNQILFNLVTILVVLFVCPRFPDQAIWILVASVIASGLLQVLFQAAVCHHYEKFLFAPRFAPDDPDIREIARLMGPVLLAAGIFQVNTLLSRIIGGALGAEAANSLYYSQQLVHLPIGLFAIALSQLCLPSLSRAWAANDGQAIQGTLDFSVRQVLFLTLPATALLCGAGDLVLCLLYKAGKFNDQAVFETLKPLACLLPAIPAYALVKIFATSFHARKDTTTPMRISFACVALNLVLGLALSFPLKQSGLALATSASALLNAYLLFHYERKHGHEALRLPVRAMFELLLAATVAGLAIWSVRHWLLPAALPTTRWKTILPFSLALGAGAVAYLGMLLLLGRQELRESLAAFRRH